MDFKNSETLKNLTRAFSAECQDGAKYQFIADMATQQKQAQIATVLKQLATNEMAHAKIFYDTISENIAGGVEEVNITASFPMQSADMLEMLKIKADNEQKQADAVYQEFARIADNEGFPDIATKFKQIAKIEECHAVVLNELYEKQSKKTLYSSKDEKRWKCTNCGHEEVAKKGWKKCPLCKGEQGEIKITLEKSAEYCNCNDECDCNDNCSCSTSSRCSSKCDCE